MIQTEMRHAYLLMAHNNVDQLNLLLTTLDSEFSDIYLHIDIKSEITEESIVTLTKSNLYFYKKMSVFWADYSQVECEVFILEQAIKRRYRYYHLLSGADFPLKTPQEIAYILEKDNRIYLHFSTMENVQNTYDYVRYYHFFQKDLSIVNRGKQFSVFKVINKICIITQKLLRVNRIQKNVQVKKGANWFSIPDDVAKYILTKKEWINKNFKYTRSGDEFFLQTVLYNSDFCNRIYRLKEDDGYESCLRHIDWKRGNPYVFQKEDYIELANCRMFFARKFDLNKDKEIILILMNKLLNNS
ncbi:beta-1,6-N-acetylglucosaminyltransferase [Robinsoniella peoriensis]|uniref:beta-1,6-N-acetylglucosaminyltransferase n=1 Tax=Robinsoniella peoriensis TaxID=180332 RepID=UPI00375350A6